MSYRKDGEQVKERVVESLYNEDFPHLVVQTLLALKEVGAVIDWKNEDSGEVWVGRITAMDDAGTCGWGVSFSLKDNFGELVSSLTVPAEQIWWISIRVDPSCGYRVRITLTDY